MAITTYQSAYTGSEIDSAIGQVSNKLDKDATAAAAVVAGKLATVINISLTGDVTGSAEFDGSGNVSIPATVVNDSHTHKYAGASTAGGAATSAAKLTTTTAGSATAPVYFDAGIPKACGTSLAVSITGNAATATSATSAAKLTTTTAGTSTKPVYFDAGIPKACGGSLAVNITGSSASCTGNAATATTATTATNATNIYSSPSTSKAYVLGTTTASSANHATVYNASVYTSGSVLYGAVWNDYAEYRICNEDFKPGQVVFEKGDDTVAVSTERLQRGCSLTSDTFGFAIGETEEAKCPIAVAGRVLAYPYESREEFKHHIGWPVCAAPNGTVSIMTEEEEMKYPSRIIGTISAVPEYEEWGADNINVNGRVWIKVK